MLPPSLAPPWQCLARTEELARQVGDTMANRIEANLGAVAAAPLLDLPPDQSFTYEEFVAQQVRGVGWGCCVLAAAGLGWAGRNTGGQSC